MYTWTNSRTNESFSGDTIGKATTFYNQYDAETQIYLGSLDVIAITISGTLDKGEADEYLTESDWSVAYTTILK